MPKPNKDTLTLGELGSASCNVEVESEVEEESACECGRSLGGPLGRRHGVLSESDQRALTSALSEAFEKSAPVLSQALSDAIQAQFERVIGRGVVAWLKRLLIAGILMLIGYTYTKTGGLK